MIYNVSKIISEKPLASYAISQGAKYQFGHIACSKTKEGQYLIDQFNINLLGWPIKKSLDSWSQSIIEVRHAERSIC